MSAPQVLASIRALFPPSEQGRALDLYGATFGLANILGQILGGVLVSSHPFGFTWQAIFLVNAPIGLAAFIGSMLFLGDSKADRAQKPDLGGVIHLTPLEAGLRTPPFGIGYFLASFASAGIMRRLGPRALTLGFVIQVLGFGGVALTVAGIPMGRLGPGLVVAGVGFGIVMPSVIKAVIGGIDQQYAGLASGIVISAFQIGAALGVAIIGGVFFSVLGTGHELVSYSRAFAVALGCNIGLLAIGGLLSLWLPAAGLRRTR